MTRLATELDAINLSQGFPDFDCAPALVEAVARYMREGHNQYAPMAGVPALREALAIKIERLYGRRCDPLTEIAVTSGATEALFDAITALVHPGDDVLLFQPAYDSYAPAVCLSGGRPVFVTLRPPGYAIDWDEVSAALTPRTRAIVINSPHNPTGTVWTPSDMTALARVLEDSAAIVIADEVYEHIVFDDARHESVHRYPGLADRAIVISSFGKTYHTTGWKVGYCVGPATLIAAVLGVHQWVTFSVNAAIQMAYADMVRQDPLCGDVAPFYQEKRDRFRRLLDGSRFRPLACDGTFFQLLDYSMITDEHDEAFAMRLTREHGVASIPITPFLDATGSADGRESRQARVLRFCFAKRDETIERAADRLRRV